MTQLEEKFDGHIILYCKGHYNLKDIDIYYITESKAKQFNLI